MKKFLFVLILIGGLLSGNSVFAKTDADLLQELQLQNRINKIGFKILNANKIDKRMVFLYSEKEAKLIKKEEGLTKRQIVIYESAINHAEHDDEVAAYLAREICKTAESYTGIWKGFLSAAQVKLAPKKYELLFDERAVDFLVAAGYNPLALITFINKAYVQKRYDKISTHNLTSKRLANIYEYIYFQHPQFLKNNEYIENEYYQNFLLTSIDNRKKLHEKIKSGKKGRIKYE